MWPLTIVIPAGVILAGLAAILFYKVSDFDTLQVVSFFQGTTRTASLQRLDGKIAIVTGSNTGLGKEIAEQLCLLGAHVVMGLFLNLNLFVLIFLSACRSRDRAEAAIADLRTRVGNEAKLEFMPLDMASLDSVREFTKLFKRTAFVIFLFLYPTFGSCTQSVGFRCICL